MIWKPDVCEYPYCELEFNGSNEPANFIRALWKCQAHSMVLDSQLTKVCLEECRRKERVRELVYQNGGKKVLSLTEKQQLSLFLAMEGRGEESVPDEIWKPSVSFDWSFDQNRNLIVNIQGLTTLEKTVIMDKLKDLETDFPTWNLEVDKIQII